MAPIREWLRRVWRGGQRSDQDLDAELQLHLELLAEEKLRQGRSPTEAAPTWIRASPTICGCRA